MNFIINISENPEDKLKLHVFCIQQYKIMQISQVIQELHQKFITFKFFFVNVLKCLVFFHMQHIYSINAFFTKTFIRKHL